MSKLIFFLRSYFVPLVFRFSAFFPFLIFISFFLLSLFILTFLVSYFPLFVVDLVSSGEEVFNHIYQSIEDNSGSPSSGDKGFDPFEPVAIEPDPTHPCSREDEDYLNSIFPDSSKHKPYLDTITRPPIDGDKVRFPCVEDDNG